MASSQQLADDLERVLTGAMPLADVLNNGNSQLYGDALNDCFPNLHHFLADDCIRARDPWYKQMQETEMRKLISLLRSGAEPARIHQITFLDFTS